jgi:N-terminal domain of toast_rack, DUF2154
MMMMRVWTTEGVLTMRKTRMVTFALIAAAVFSGHADAQDQKRVTLSRQLDGDGPIDVEVRYGVGRLHIRPLEMKDMLFRAQLKYDEGVFRPVDEYSPGELRIGAETLSQRARFGRNMESGELDLELSTEVPMDLDLEFGAVKANIDLGGLRLTRLELSTGASETRLRVSEPNTERLRMASFEVGAAAFTARELGNLNAERITLKAGVGDIRLDFTGEWREDGRVSIEMGLGSLELRLPRGLGVKLIKDTFLVSLDSQGLVKRGDAYYSLDYDDADVRLTIDIDAAFGGIDVVWVR